MSNLPRYSILGHLRPDGELLAYDDFKSIIESRDAEIERLKEVISTTYNFKLIKRLNYMNIKEQLEEYINLKSKDYHKNKVENQSCLMTLAYLAGVNEMKELLLIAVSALKCNETFHRLGGLDDCDPCKALAEIKEKIKGSE